MADVADLDMDCKFSSCWMRSVCAWKVMAANLLSLAAVQESTEEEKMEQKIINEGTATGVRGTGKTS